MDGLRSRFAGPVYATLWAGLILSSSATAQKPAPPTYVPTSAYASYAYPVPIRPSAIPHRPLAAESPASRTARYDQLGGGVGPMPGYANAPGYHPLFLPGAGRDPAGSRGIRVIRGDGWGLRNGRGLPFGGRLGFNNSANPGMPYGTGINIGLPY